MRRAIEKYLEKIQFTLIETASDGEAALELFKRHLPDLVTLDITMPKMDGLACLDQMLRIKPDARIIIISALKDPATGLQALKKGARGFLAKPFTPAQLQAEIEDTIGEKQDD
jgi:two-component system chemotaxis response regulator CheY